MPERVDKDVEYCRQRADECQRMAVQETHPALKQDYLDLEARWLKLAACYEFPDRMIEYSARLACTLDQSRETGPTAHPSELAKAS